MKPPPFDYIVPGTLDEALHAARQGGSEAKYLAGGQSLVPAMNFRIAQPACSSTSIESPAWMKSAARPTASTSAR